MNQSSGIVILLLFCVPVLPVRADEPPITSRTEWNGYTQLRGSMVSPEEAYFSLRRLKFWLKSGSEFSEHWQFKVQAQFANPDGTPFLLQDVYVSYLSGNSRITMGQFIPEFSLQRFQHDYTLTLDERSMIINALIPGSFMGIRDLGLQVGIHSQNKKFYSSLGLFNGYGTKYFNKNNHGFMLTHKGSFQTSMRKNNLLAGYSILYREVENMSFSMLLPDSVLFSGTDFKYNVFLKFKRPEWEVQFEYIRGYLNEKTVTGYYFLASLSLNPKNRVGFMLDHLTDQNPDNDDHTWYTLGYNYYINDYKLKISLNNRFQPTPEKINYQAEIQLQIFFRQ